MAPTCSDCGRSFHSWEERFDHECPAAGECNCDNCGATIELPRGDVPNTQAGMDPNTPRNAMGGKVFCCRTCQGEEQGWLE